MIFGFNTDIKHAEIVYHVQSEVRQHEAMLQTQVFVRGRCVGKRATGIGNNGAPPDSSEQQLHEMLKVQHREVLEAIRTGNIDALFAPAAPLPDLKLEWVNAEPRMAESTMVLHFRITAGEAPVNAARVAARLDSPGLTPTFVHGETAPDGTVELRIPLERAAAADSTLLVQATHTGRTCRSKFRLRKK